MASSGTVRDTQFEAIRRAILREGLDGEKLTAREILRVVEDAEVNISSPHEVATVLGYHSDDASIQVIEDSPYKYKFY
ncbi:MAG: hypothetical protein SXQ77_07790 [Halobacteria archaeon]|nr:hypothetical protein [Halobacteria archaeon]